MIRRLQIEGYRSCLDTSFELHPHLAVLIGPNSSGKTNILNALLLLRKLTERESFYYPGEEKPTGRCKLKIWFEIGGKKVILTANIYTYTDENNSDVVVHSRQQWYLKDFTGNAKRLKIPLWLVRRVGMRGEGPDILRYYSDPHHYFPVRRDRVKVPESAAKPLRAIVRFLSDMEYYSASQFTNPANCPVSFEIEKEGERSRGLGLRGHAKFLFDLYDEFKSQNPGYQQFFDIVGPQGIGLVNKIDFKDILTSSIDYLSYSITSLTA